MRTLIIVARNRVDLWAVLTEAFAADEDVKIILDRRREKRRRWVQPLTLIGGKAYITADSQESRSHNLS